MDSASPNASRIAGQTSLFTGSTFKFAFGTNKAENVALDWLPRQLSRGYRDVYYRSPHGEGRPA